jgi:hypothetical protein
MTGMKEGAGEDPFADDDPVDTSDDDQCSESEANNTEPESRESGGSSDQQVAQIPYKFRRDSVHEGRDRVPLFLMPETKRLERDAQRELEERFDSDVALTDLRESLMKVGLQHLDEAEVHLKEWGYGLTFNY